MLDRNACTRNCWVAGGAVGLIVLLLTTALGGIGVAGGIFLGLVAGGLVGGALIWLVRDGQPAPDPDLPDVAPFDADTTFETTAGAVLSAAVLPLIDPAALRAPSGIVAGTTSDVGPDAVLARPGAAQAPTFGAAAPDSDASARAAKPAKRAPPAKAADKPAAKTAKKAVRSGEIGA